MCNISEVPISGTFAILFSHSLHSWTISKYSVKIRPFSTFYITQHNIKFLRLLATDLQSIIISPIFRYIVNGEFFVSVVSTFFRLIPDLTVNTAVSIRQIVTYVGLHVSVSYLCSISIKTGKGRQILIVKHGHCFFSFNLIWFSGASLKSLVALHFRWRSSNTGHCT